MIFCVKTGKNDTPITASPKTANLVCRGAGDSHLPRSMRARSPHVLCSSGGGSTRCRTSTKGAGAAGIVHNRGDFVLCTISRLHFTDTILLRRDCILPFLELFYIQI